MGINQVKKEYNFVEKVVFKAGGPHKLYDVYSGVHKDTKEAVSIWSCKVSKLKEVYRGQWEKVQELLLKEITFLENHQTAKAQSNFFLNLKGKPYINKNEIVFVTEPVLNTLAACGKSFFHEEIECKLKFSYLFEGINKLHKMHNILHNNITKNSILVTMDKKRFKLFGFFFNVAKKNGKKNGSLLRALLKQKFKPSFLNENFIKKNESNLKNLDMILLEKITSEYFKLTPTDDNSNISLEIQIYQTLNTEALLALKKITNYKTEKLEKLPSLLNIIYLSRFSKFIFIKYVKDFLFHVIKESASSNSNSNFASKNDLKLILPIFFKYIPKLDKSEFINLIMPKFAVMFNIWKPIIIPLLLTKQIQMFLKYTNKTNYKKRIVTFLLNCLDQNNSELLIEALRMSELNVNNGEIDKNIFLEKFLPKIIKLIRHTSYGIVKLNAVVCIGKTLSLINDDQVIEMILPTLKYALRDEKSPVTIMNIVGVYGRVCRTLDIKIVSNQVLPFIIPLLTRNNIDEEKFSKIMKVVRRLLEKIEKEKKFRYKNLNELGSHATKKKNVSQVNVVKKVMNEKVTLTSPEPPTPPPKSVPKTRKRKRSIYNSNFDFIKINSKKLSATKKKTRVGKKRVLDLDFDILDKKAEEEKKVKDITKTKKMTNEHSRTNNLDNLLNFEDIVKKEGAKLMNEKKDVTTVSMGMGKGRKPDKSKVDDIIGSVKPKKKVIKKTPIKKKTAKKVTKKVVNKVVKKKKDNQLNISNPLLDKNTSMEKITSNRDNVEVKKEENTHGEDVFNDPRSEEGKLLGEMGIIRGIFMKNQNHEVTEKLREVMKEKEKENKEEEEKLDNLLDTINLDKINDDSTFGNDEKTDDDEFSFDKPKDNDPFGDDDDPYKRNDDNVFGDDLDLLSQVNTGKFGSPKGKTDFMTNSPLNNSPLNNSLMNDFDRGSDSFSSNSNNFMNDSGSLKKKLENDNDDGTGHDPLFDDLLSKLQDD